MAKKRFKFPEIQILEVFEQLTLKKDQTPSDCAELTVAAAQEFRKASTGYIRLYDGVTDMLEQLKQAGNYTSCQMHREFSPSLRFSHLA